MYQNAGEDLKKSLEMFNESLHDANLLIGIGTPLQIAMR